MNDEELITVNDNAIDKFDINVPIHIKNNSTGTYEEPNQKFLISGKCPVCGLKFGEQQVKTLESVLRYLEIGATESDIERIAERTFSVKSSTFRQGRTGAWRKYFKPDHISLFKSVAGNELIKFGYEDSNDW